MTCPKCGSKLTVDSGGYARANTALGLGTPLPTNHSCIMCGYYKEVFAEKEVIVKDFKNHNNYPDVRRSLGDAGWLKGMVKAEFNTIARWRATGMVWGEIRKRLTKKYPAISETGHDSISNVWRRLERENNDPSN